MNADGAHVQRLTTNAAIDGAALVEKVHGLNPGGVDQRRRALQADADDAHGNAVHDFDADWKKYRQTCALVDHVGREVVKLSVGEGVTVLATVCGVAATALQPP